MELKGIKLGEISQSEKDKYHDYTHTQKLRNKIAESRAGEVKSLKDENKGGDKP